MRNLAILGAGGHGRVVAETAVLLGWRTILFFDDAWPKRSVSGTWEIVGNTQTLIDCANEVDGVVVAIGDNYVRMELIAEFLRLGLNVPALVHPRAFVSSDSQIGSGTVVLAGAVVQTGSSIEAGCIINTSASIDHDCHIGSAVHVCPGAHLAGNVTAGSRCTIGVGASVSHGISIGHCVVIGAGAVVINDLVEGITVVGNPARIISAK